MSSMEFGGILDILSAELRGDWGDGSGNNCVHSLWQITCSLQRHMTYINNLIYVKVVTLAMLILEVRRVTCDLVS